MLEYKKFIFQTLQSKIRENKEGVTEKMKKMNTSSMEEAPKEM